jgi:rhodanese-related sulfurtransferase
MSESQPETVARMVAEARLRIENLPVKRVVAEIEEEDVLLVDVREDDERLLEGAIPNSMHVPRGMLELSADLASPSIGKSSIPSVEPSSIVPRGPGQRWGRIPSEGWVTRTSPTSRAE